MKQLAILNPENASEQEMNSYPAREAARAIVIDTDGKIALLHVSKRGYYKLPGGGIEVSEDQVTALRRECREEIGCDVEVIDEVGTIIEFMKKFSLKHISHCYLARVSGEKSTPTLTDDEREDGIQNTWLRYEEVKRAFAEESANFVGRLYIVPRDRRFLEEAESRLNKFV